jgi:hypothetical protein
VRTGAEHDIGAAQADQFGDAQSGLQGHKEHGVVAPSDPGIAIGCGEQGLHLIAGQEVDGIAVVALVRHGEDALDERGVCRLLQGDIAKEGVQRGQPRVAGACLVAPTAFQIIEKARDQRGIEIGEADCRGRLLQPQLHEREQQPKGVAVGGDGMRAGLPLLHQTLGEERLEQVSDGRGNDHG